MPTNIFLYGENPIFIRALLYTYIHMNERKKNYDLYHSSGLDVQPLYMPVCMHACEPAVSESYLSFLCIIYLVYNTA